MEIPSNPGDLLELLARLALAAALGGLLGVHREFNQKPAGLRTHALVALGAALVTLISLQVCMLDDNRDINGISRAIQGIVTGVGFVGAGVILHRDDDRGVHGLTTAASIWVVAAVGIAAGAGLWRAAVVTLGLSLLVLAAGTPVDAFLRRRRAKESPQKPPL